MVDSVDFLIAREQTSLRQLVVSRLRDLILEGVLTPGQKLVERELCERLGVSRTLLREALQQLQAEGLITNALHRGPSVAVITEQDARDLYDVREVLESRAGRGFALNASPAQVDRLAASLTAMRDPQMADNAREQLLAKNAFYQILLEGCGNTVIAQMLLQLNNRITILRRLTLSHPGRWAETIAELEAIVAGCRRGAADEVADLCARHVARAAQIALSSYEHSASAQVSAG